MRERVVVLLALAALGTAPAFALDLQAPRFTRDRMESALAPGGDFLFVYGTRRPESAAAMRPVALRMARDLFDRDSTAVRADRDVSPESLAAHAVVLVGSAADNAWTDRLGAALPVAFTPRGFRWFDTAYERSGDVIRLVFPHPLAPMRFLILVAGNSAEALKSRVALPREGEDWRIERDGALVRSGRFAQSEGAPWRYDPALDHDLERERDRFAARLRPRVAPGVEWRALPAEPRAAPCAQSAARLLARLGSSGFPAADPAPLRVTMYASLEDKGRLLRDTRPEQIVSRREAAVAIPAGRAEPDLWSVAALRLVSLGASPDAVHLEPAGAWLAGRWGGEPLERAIARLYFARLLPTAREAALARDTWRSPLLLVPARAALMRAIYETAGPSARPRGARAGDPRAAAVLAVLGPRTPGTLDSLCRFAGVPAREVERRYALLVDSLARLGRAGAADMAPRMWRPADGFIRGVCLTHEAGVERGYLSSACARELDRVRALPADWIALVPYGTVPGTGAPEIYPSADGGPDEETDEAVSEAAARAGSRGLRVLLAPRLWTRGWSGDLKFGATRWPRFFDRYREFLLHYAVLAQRERLSALAVGHELGRATAADPDRWRALIGEVRRVYDGTLVYSASAEGEAAVVPFWDACDLIGVSFFPPLAASPGASRESMAGAARKALEPLRALARRTGRPVLITAAGYASVPDAAARPRDESRGRPADPEAQRRAWDALCTALDPEDWCAGVFAWRWGSAPPLSGAADGSFRLAGKPVEATLARWYSAWRDRPVRPPRR